MVPLTDRILDHFPDPTVLLDGRRSVIYANGAARELLDITRVGHDLAMSLRHPRVLDAVDQVLGRDETRTVEVILPGNTTRNRAQTKECYVRHARNQAQYDEDNGRDTQRLGGVEHLLQYLPAHVLAGRYPGNHDRCRRRQQQ